MKTHLAVGSKYIFYIAFFIYMTTLMLELTVLIMNDTFNFALSYIRYFCYLMVFVKICIDFVRDRQVFIFIVALAIAVATALIASNRIILFYMLFLIAARNVDIDKVIKIVVIMQGVLLAVIIGLSQMGIILDYVESGRNRHCLGFAWANYAPFIFIFFMLGYIYLRRDRFKIYELLIFEAINYILYIVTDTKFTFAMGIIAPIYLFLMRYYWQNHGERIRKNRLLVAAPAALCVFTFLIHYCYKPENAAWSQLNSLLSGRLALGKAALQTYGVSLFGTNITWVGFGITGTATGEYNYVDSGYLKTMFDSGLVVLCLIIVMYTVMMYYAVKQKDFYLQTALLVALILSITDPMLFHIEYNVFPFFIAESFRAVREDAPEYHLMTRARPFRLRATQIRLKNRK